MKFLLPVVKLASARKRHKLSLYGFLVFSSYVSSRRVSRSGAGGGGVKSLCFKIGYREPTRAEGREGTSTLAESPRMFLGDVTLDSDWLPRAEGARF